MTTNVNGRYLNLLKHSLTGYLHIENEYANGIRPRFWNQKSWWKTLRNRLLLRWLNRSNMLVVRRDRRTVAERKKAREEGTDWPALAETMVGLKRLDNLEELIQKIIQDKVPGDLIETGVWRGGASIFMRAVLAVHDVTDRDVILCDSFEGLPPPDPNKYPDDLGDVHHTFGVLAVSLEEVAHNFERYGLLDDRVRFVKGYFEDTLPSLDLGPLALLRLDGDMYGSTMVTLESLYDKVSPGGFVIVDDFGLGPCRKAIEDFRQARRIVDEIIRIDDSSVYWRKTT